MFIAYFKFGAVSVYTVQQAAEALVLTLKEFFCLLSHDEHYAVTFMDSQKTYLESATECRLECCEESGKCPGISHCLESGHPATNDSCFKLQH